ncbi:MAG: 16S rRNA (guanine(527)-N(7))-methyltransferase RsmG, partial [Ignavibacteriae bacterium]|nr:16S rRNA (guanine(527)-N(7))-methyltransferase RsmG [Ignavibacteriota bacterium]
MDLLLEWNSKLNLISRKDEQRVWTSHILHSLSILFLVRIPKRSKVLDLGTGGGLPGIPISIARPDISVTHVDSIHKKVVAVKDVIERLHLTNASVVCSRAEDLPGEHPGQEVRYHIVVSRGVT